MSEKKYSVADVLNADLWSQSDRNDRAEAAKQAKSETWARMQSIYNTAKDQKRTMRASEQREYDQLEAKLDELGDIENQYVDRAGVVAPTGPSAAYREGRPLAKGQSFVGHAQAMGHKQPRAVQDALEDAGRPLSLSKALNGAFTGDWRDAEPERIVMALSGASAGSGGVLLPTILTSRIIDLARAKTRVLQAGAQIVPMESRTVDVARWLADPALSWRGENEPIAETDPALDKVTLEAKSLAAVTKVSRELVEDSNIDDQLAAAFAQALALEMDRASLYGTGLNNQPTGVKNTPGVSKTPLGTDGGVPTWDDLVDSVGRLRDANEEPTAQILADRTARALAGIKDTTGQYIAPPAYLEGVQRLSTSQVPLDLTTGTSGDTSDVFTADWTELFIGLRTGLQITLLTERYMPDAGQYGFVAWWRGDMAVARPRAFDVITGVRQ